MMAPDVVVLDRADAERLAREAGLLFASLRHAEQLAHGSTDDRMREVYAEIRQALGCSRWIHGGLREATAC